MSTRVSQDYSCARVTSRPSAPIGTEDGGCAALKRASSPPGTSSTVIGVEAVVAPLAVDVEEAGGVADLAEAELLDHAQGVGVLGADRDLDPVQAAGGEAVVDRHREGARDDAAAGVLLVDPVAGRANRAEPRTMLLIVSWPAKSPSTSRRRGASARRAPAAQLGAPGRGRCAARASPGRHGGVPARAARRRCGGGLVPGPGVGGRAGAGPRLCPSAASPASRSPARARSMVAPGDLLDRVHEQRRSDLETVLHPAARARQVDHEAAADDAGEPARQHRGGHALGRRRRPGSPRRSPAPRSPGAAG